MSWATCYSGSNNIEFNFPPIMSDGRNYATWQPEAVVNKRIQQMEHIKSNWSYREYMTHHGLQIMKYDTLEAHHALGLYTHIHTNETPSSNVPFLCKSTYDNSKPGFGYNNSDLKNMYVSREQLQARMMAPSFHPM